MVTAKSEGSKRKLVAMGLPEGRGAEAQTVLAAFVEEMKSTGFVADALKRHRIEGAAVAPSQPAPDNSN